MSKTSYKNSMFRTQKLYMTSSVSRKSARELNTALDTNKFTFKSLSKILGVGINKVEREFRDMFQDVIDRMKTPLYKRVDYFCRDMVIAYIMSSKYVNDGRFLFFTPASYKRYKKAKKSNISLYITEDVNENMSRTQMQYVLEWWNSLPPTIKIKHLGGKQR